MTYLGLKGHSLHKSIFFVKNEDENQIRSVFTIVLVLLSGISLISGPGAMNYANARYANTQTQANAK